MKYHYFFFFHPGSKWNYHCKKEHSLSRDDFETDILLLSLFNKSNPSES